MTQYLRISEVADLLRVTPQTVRKYRDNGMITGYPTFGGQTIYDKDEIIALMKQRSPELLPNVPKKSVHYARSSDGSKTRIQNQLQQLKEKYGEPDYEIKDAGSGLIELAKEGKIEVVRVTQKDRLTRFGTTYLEKLFESYGVEIVYAFETEDKTLQEELMQDFMHLIASFSGKFYRLRGYAQQKKLLDNAEKKLEEKIDAKTN